MVDISSRWMALALCVGLTHGTAAAQDGGALVLLNVATAPGAQVAQAAQRQVVAQQPMPYGNGDRVARMLKAALMSYRELHMRCSTQTVGTDPATGRPRGLFVSWSPAGFDALCLEASSFRRFLDRAGAWLAEEPADPASPYYGYRVFNVVLYEALADFGTTHAVASEGGDTVPLLEPGQPRFPFQAARLVAGGADEAVGLVTLGRRYLAEAKAARRELARSLFPDGGGQTQRNDRRPCTRGWEPLAAEPTQVRWFENGNDYGPRVLVPAARFAEDVLLLKAAILAGRAVAVDPRDQQALDELEQQLVRLQLLGSLNSTACPAENGFERHHRLVPAGSWAELPGRATD